MTAMTTLTDPDGKNLDRFWDWHRAVRRFERLSTIIHHVHYLCNDWVPRRHIRPRVIPRSRIRAINDNAKDASAGILYLDDPKVSEMHERYRWEDQRLHVVLAESMNSIALGKYLHPGIMSEISLGSRSRRTVISIESDVRPNLACTTNQNLVQAVTPPWVFHCILPTETDGMRTQVVIRLDDDSNVVVIENASEAPRVALGIFEDISVEIRRLMEILTPTTAWDQPDAGFESANERVAMQELRDVFDPSEKLPDDEDESLAFVAQRVRDLTGHHPTRKATCKL
ncbi:hypothetical protein SISNIDRAFT_466991 [Sistotremastrum niveocremeum HHB9708]|uniref:Uncharacterized protein n=1 Tax=Sistotremastrum niveocremeum HHB9708 TaxID=1314777 RepID=A0A164T723_9AGAM|nr:hypothetical protein SISNIDRAFT_466991 [Sistotremastrum niveocremeum HHB9708]